MDAVIFLILSVILAWKILDSPDAVDTSSKTVIEPEDTTNRVAKLNETFYEDDNAFMELANALGFTKGGMK